MSEGFVVDVTHGGFVQQKWIEGEPVKSVWLGLKTRGREAYHVRTYRCDSCGFLESYAQAPAE